MMSQSIVRVLPGIESMEREAPLNRCEFSSGFESGQNVTQCNGSDVSK